MVTSDLHFLGMEGLWHCVLGFLDSKEYLSRLVLISHVFCGSYRFEHQYFNLYLDRFLEFLVTSWFREVSAVYRWLFGVRPYFEVSFFCCIFPVSCGLLPWYIE